MNLSLCESIRLRVRGVCIMHGVLCERGSAAYTNQHLIRTFIFISLATQAWAYPRPYLYVCCVLCASVLFDFLFTREPRYWFRNQIKLLFHFFLRFLSPFSLGRHTVNIRWSTSTPFDVYKYFLIAPNSSQLSFPMKQYVYVRIMPSISSR